MEVDSRGNSPIDDRHDLKPVFLLNHSEIYQKRKAHYFKGLTMMSL